MNREIKFRGISSFSKKWVYGDYAIIDGLPSIIEDSIEFIDGSELRSYSWDYVIPDTIGQFTGLKDKNGKEIYEGDIVYIITDYSAFIFKIVFDNGCFCLADNKCEVWDVIHEDGLEVIGNVHDNKELLNEE